MVQFILTSRVAGRLPCFRDSPPAKSARGLALLFSLGAGLGIVSSCGGGEVTLPLGDDLDQLLNSASAFSVYDSALRDCVVTEGGDPAELSKLTSSAGRANASMKPVSLDPTGETSGIVLEALNEAEGTDARLQAQPEVLTQELEDILYHRLVMFGEEEVNGCAAFAEQTRLESPVEVSRMLLQERYIEQITSRFSSDPRVLAANKDWSECMQTQGFPGLSKPGGQMLILTDMVEQSSRTVDELTALLDYDRRITSAVKNCIDETHLLVTVGDVRLEYDSTFVRDNREELESLLLLLREE